MDASFEKIPQVDLTPMRGSERERKALASALSEICHQVGFFVITDHGIDVRLVDTVFSVSQSLFELPLEQKRLIDKRQSRHFRGWEAVGTEYTNGRPDIREQVDLWSEHPPRAEDVTPNYLRLLGPNQWLPETVLPDFRATLQQWFTQLGALADELLALLALGLGLPERQFEDLFGDERMSLTKLIRYPATPPGQFGVNAHHDTGFLTLLATGGVAGLQVENPDGQWIDVPCIPDSFVVNLGEMLQAMTGNYFVATPHRVVANQERYSAGYFHGPSLHTLLEPLELPAHITARVAASPRHAEAGYMARREETEAGVGDMQSRYRPDVYGEQLWNYFSRSYPANMALHYPSTAESTAIAAS